MGKIVRFDPNVHLPVTDEDRSRIENTLWEGWELMVDETSGDVWIGDREEKIAHTRRMVNERIGNEAAVSRKAV